MRQEIIWKILYLRRLEDAERVVLEDEIKWNITACVSDAVLARTDVEVQNKYKYYLVGQQFLIPFLIMQGTSRLDFFKNGKG